MRRLAPQPDLSSSPSISLLLRIFPKVHVIDMCRLIPDPLNLYQVRRFSAKAFDDPVSAITRALKVLG
jgi:hypothetical protein